ncbi:unnamed protein product [Ambrosiozyma monospora]|uniref:Unnamed protein product n=1 Tax=Ambrosiozyma monospora TaxID=43982 RepID=A0ACB5UBE0_AMBMO|nr:unnamed protein product [Ambrosiozyma monospora]
MERVLKLGIYMKLEMPCLHTKHTINLQFYFMYQIIKSRARIMNNIPITDINQLEFEHRIGNQIDSNISFSDKVISREDVHVLYGNLTITNFQKFSLTIL